MRLARTICLLCIFGINQPSFGQDEGLVDGLTNWLHNLSSLDMGIADPIAEFELTRGQVPLVRKVLWTEWVERNQEAFSKAIAAKELGKEPALLKWLERRFGDSDSKLKPLFISMHGGGGAPTRVNDQQWNNQIRLYEPSEGIVVAPRAPGNTWDLWHQSPVDGLFDQLIAAYVATEHVDPNRVYLMGYSAGGDGVYQLAPRMADRFAAASMMAGHPNEASPLGLRNLPFSLFVGEKDGAYNRNKVALDWGAKLDALQKEDHEGYLHWVKTNPDKPHWMGGEDREAVPWMLRYQRQTVPKKIVWYQDDVTHPSFYWLSIATPQNAKGGTKITASVNGNRIAIETESKEPLHLWLSDDLVDLKLPVEVTWNGKMVYRELAPRRVSTMLECLLAHNDPSRIFPAKLKIEPTSND